MVTVVESTTVVTYDAMLRSMFLPAGETYDWFYRNVRRPMHMRAVRNTPVRRHGLLKRRNYSRQIGTNQYLIRIELGNTAPYAAVVHEGYPGIIVGRPWLWLGAQSDFPYRGSKAKKRVIEVMGQHGNPFLAEAMRWSLARKGLA